MLSLVAHSGHCILLCFAVVFGAIYAHFLPCVGFSIEGWDPYPTPEEKAAHRGNSGVLRFLPCPWVSALQVYFQLQPGISQVPQRLFKFRFSTAEEAKQYRCYTSVTGL